MCKKPAASDTKEGFPDLPPENFALFLDSVPPSATEKNETQITQLNLNLLLIIISIQYMFLRSTERLL